MSKILMFVPGIGRSRFTGGLLSVFQYANGLVRRGHDVTVVPITPSSRPQWFDAQFRISLRPPTKFPSPDDARRRTSMRERTRLVIRRSLLPLLARGPYSYKRASQIERFRGLTLEADVTLATSYETALVAHLSGTGEKFYFAQHFETVFADQLEYPSYAEIDARLSYLLPLKLIANSSWLQSRLQEETGRHVELCVNGIDTSVFFPDGAPRVARDKFIVGSYAGRGVPWKGFADAAQAVRLARYRVSNLEWKVFGEASGIIEDVANESLGFITGADLRRAYSAADVFLAPAWYESFPLYPLEAMACGSALVTTPLGTEDYAHHMQNAIVVPPRNPEAMAEAIVLLHEQPELRERIGRAGVDSAARFSWDQSVDRMAALLGVA